MPDQDKHREPGAQNRHGPGQAVGAKGIHGHPCHRRAGGAAYQWGGIMCWDGKPIAGMYGACNEVLKGQAGASVRPASAGGGWMAFAIGADGRFGHGAGATRNEAIGYAMQYCGDASCGIKDVTQAQCHALASGNRNGHWFGAGNSKQAAESFAMGFCTNSESSCTVRYSHCR